jgi:hypothetical protein
MRMRSAGSRARARGTLADSASTGVGGGGNSDERARPDSAPTVARRSDRNLPDAPGQESRGRSRRRSSSSRQLSRLSPKSPSRPSQAPEPRHAPMQVSTFTSKAAMRRRKLSSGRRSALTWVTRRRLPISGTSCAPPIAFLRPRPSTGRPAPGDGSPEQEIARLDAPAPAAPTAPPPHTRLGKATEAAPISRLTMHQ